MGGLPPAPAAAEERAQRPAVEEGGRVYREACAPCHGERGDGKGQAARALDPPPRDFTTGTYKFRSTPSGSVPCAEDLLRTVSEGIPGTMMPAWKDHLSLRERRLVVAYVMAFSPRFTEEKPERLVPEALRAPNETAALLQRGRALYRLMRCAECHGESGRGDVRAAATLRDDAGRPISPLDFTRGLYKGGSSPADVYRTFVTGLSGTPMPAYGDSLPNEEDRWALVYYVKSHSRGFSIGDYLFGRQTPWR